MDGQKLRSQSYRASGRTVIRSFESVHDRPPPESPDTPLSSSMEGAYGPDMPAALVSGYQAPGWNSVQALNRFQHEIGGSMRRGTSGIRLLSRARHDDAAPQPYAYPTDIPAPHAARADAVLVLPDTRLFGSEELSMLCAPVMARATAPVLGLPADMVASDRMVLHLGDGPHVLPVQSVPGLPAGIVLCPAHMVARALRFPRMARLDTIPDGDEPS